ncbi:MAG TPA: hypothetical protein PLU37_10510 [Chitinophagaceae bacterium]|nr:hypothetical protein [Chitinophagaceae bacterium]MCB9056906.1 hypothetical protein [Chitinophagales bacterium]HPG11954.1 hypothetical protein [Chitinophagaceae bacterium]
MKRKRIKRIIFFSAAIILVTVGLYAFSEYNRKVKDLSKVKADMEISAADILAEYEKDEAASNQLYLDKVIAVKGTVKSLEKNDKGHYSVVLGNENSMASVRCSMDSIHQRKAEDLVTGSVVTVKGACTGFNSNDLLGSDLILNRCVIQN